MPGHDDQTQLGPIAAQLLKHLQGHRLFRLLRAAGEKDHVVRGQSGQCGQATRGGIVAIGLGAVVLHGTRDLDCFRPGPQGAESLGIGFILHGDAIDAPEQPRYERPDAAIAFEAPLAQAAVDDRGPRTVTPGGPNQVRPEFQLGQHEHVGPDPPHGRIHGPGKIQRAIEDGPAGIFLLGQRHAGLRGRGDHALPIGPLALDQAEQRGQQVHFAHAHGMQPDALLVRCPPRRPGRAVSRHSLRDTCPCGWPTRPARAKRPGAGAGRRY